VRSQEAASELTGGRAPPLDAAGLPSHDPAVSSEIERPGEPVGRRPRRPGRRVLAALAAVLVIGAGGGAWLAMNQLTPANPIAKAAQTFAGHPRQADIRSRLNIAFAIYGLEPTDENYAKATLALVLLREAAVADGFPQLTEMGILEGMIADGGLPGSTFPEAAGYSAFALRIFPN
jgi:hypothetical protein